MIRPSQNAVTLPFGSTDPPYSPGNAHKGTDFAPSPDNRIYAPEAGQCVLRPDDGSCGRAIHMYVGNRHHAFCHTSRYLVAPGEYVQQGQAIAVMGDTGFAQGVHLHWALAINGTLVDPLSQVTGGNMSDVENATNIANVRLGWLNSIEAELGISGEDEHIKADSAVSGIRSLNGIARLRGDRFTEIAKLLGVDSGDNYEGIYAAIQALQKGSTAVTKQSAIDYMTKNLK